MKKTLLTILLATSMVSAYAEGNHKGGHNAGAHWMAPKTDAAKVNPIKSDPASIDRGKKSYFQYCASCHGAKAMGDGPAAAKLNPKPANLMAMSGGHPDGDFAWKIKNGRGAMPAWKSVLKEDQVWDLVNYIQALNPKGKMMDMSKMDHSKMSAEDMKKMMPNMDHSKMSAEDMKKMMPNMGHSNSDKGHSH